MSTTSCKRLLNQRPTDMDLSGKRILVVKPSSLGDVVHTLPVVHALKRCYPHCHIGWIVQSSFKGVIEHDPAVDEILPISIPSTSEPGSGPWVVARALAATLRTLRGLRKRLKAAPYDVVLDLHASLRSGFMGLVNPAGLRIGFSDAKELNPVFQHVRLVTDPAQPHAVDKNLAFARHFGCTPISEDFRVVTGEQALERARAFLAESGIRDQEPRVYANPATRWETKHWTVDGWASVADMLAVQAGIRVIFCGGPGDRAYIERITAKMKSPPVVAAGRLTLIESAALMGLCDLYLGVDSGPMHIAAFSGRPVVAVFGPTDPAKVGPYGSGHRVVRNEALDCLACRKRACNEHACMAGITAEQVFSEVLTVLKSEAKQGEW
ncbi:MAG: glycosyltransferase family 9 protein [Thermodesulfobacteriota bacterium]